MKFEKLESNLVLIIDSLEGNLPSEQLGDMRDLARSGEYGVAFENLCTQLFEYEVAISPMVFASLKDMGTLMNLDSENWTQLEVKPPRQAT